MWSQERLNRIWYDGEKPTVGMRLLAPLYRGATALHRALYRSGLLRRQGLPVPVLVVGNLTTGGTGKTPLVIALVEALTARGWTPGVVSRGYGGSQREPALLDARPDPARFGDEPCLIRQHCALVAVGRERAAVARLLIDEGADLVIADDGLQHHALARDVEICVLDGRRRLGNGRLLPAGPLRESPRRLAACDWIVINGGSARESEIPMRLESSLAVNCVDQTTRPLSEFAGKPVHAVAGIGNPGRFFDSLRQYGVEPIEHAFPDHHAYAPADLDFGDDVAVLMTEKDAVKCIGFASKNAWRVPVHAALPGRFLDALAGRLRNLTPPSRHRADIDA